LDELPGAINTLLAKRQKRLEGRAKTPEEKAKVVTYFQNLKPKIESELAKLKARVQAGQVSVKVDSTSLALKKKELLKERKERKQKLRDVFIQSKIQDEAKKAKGAART